jgi:hypothetical protein
VKAFVTPQTLVNDVDDAKSQLIPRAIFWKERWAQFRAPPRIQWRWQSVPFDRSALRRVPNDRHGIYTFVLTPNVAAHPKNHFILYVGKAEKTTLRERFQHYFQEMQKIKRPHICYALNKYEGHLQFCYATIPNRSDIQAAEDALLTALMPPFNENFPAEVSSIIACLR